MSVDQALRPALEGVAATNTGFAVGSLVQAGHRAARHGRRLRRSRPRPVECGREARHHAVLGLAGLADPAAADGDRRDPDRLARAPPRTSRPGQLSNPIINITSPTSLPDPVGTAAILQAVQNGGMFRDMSGLQATIGLLQSRHRADDGRGIGRRPAGGREHEQPAQGDDRAAAHRRRDGQPPRAHGRLGVHGRGHPAGRRHDRRGGGGGGSSQQGAKINYFDKTAKTAPAGWRGGRRRRPGWCRAGCGRRAPRWRLRLAGSRRSRRRPTRRTPPRSARVWGNTKSPSRDRGGPHRQVGLDATGPRCRPRSRRPRRLGARRAWPNLDPVAVQARIEELRPDPNLFYYGWSWACAPPRTSCATSARRQAGRVRPVREGPLRVGLRVPR